ncbi:conserved membrane hypothetical protein [Flavobacterium sp. 9AF]|uniref:hypothetical protein n=1 Tax=Flavobacterium sp. 9AF TaxID=2653142 RepID=UPI0012F39123|nr:hypothetical protein [Flavobacterium sp. 9AF]VXB98179.1 conserved membrane hypothetical protein [Flavobacterium sp. 9AF]
MSHFLDYLGCYTVAIPIILGILLLLFLNFMYCKLKGPNKSVANFSFYIPMLCAVVLGVLLFYTTYLWITFALYFVILILVNMASFKVLAEALEDKTGLGVAMFSGLVSSYIFVFCFLVKLIVDLF